MKGMAWLMIAMAAGCCSTPHTAKTEQPPAHPGAMIEVDGRALHYVETSGHTTTVLLDAGGGTFSTFWQPVQHLLGKQTPWRVISYDRAGLGWSDTRPGEYHIGEDADDLLGLIAALEIDGPIILVGTSYAAFVLQAALDRQPADVVGIVLVEPNTPHFFAAHPATVKQIELEGQSPPARGIKKFAMRLQKRGFVRSLGGGPTAAAAFDRLVSVQNQNAAKAALRAFGETLDYFSPLSWPAIPMILISRGRAARHFPWDTPERERDWRAGHHELAMSHPCAEHRVAENSDHAAALQQPQLVLEAVLAVAGLHGVCDSHQGASQ